MTKILSIFYILVNNFINNTKSKTYVFSGYKYKKAIMNNK